MDFIEWCHHILQILENKKFSSHFDEYQLQEILFGETAQQPGFHESDSRQGMFQALEALKNADLIEETDYFRRATPLGRKVLSDPTDYWTIICEEPLEAEEEKILRLVNRLNAQRETNPPHAWLKEIGSHPILAMFGIKSIEQKTNEQMEELRKYVYDLPEQLEQRVFLKTDAQVGYYNDVRPTYQGLVWDTRRGFTADSRLIDRLVEEWETTNVDFKREIHLDTKKQKAEFARDVLGLATTKSSGRRYLIIGFDDKTRTYHAPPNDAVTQDRMERILSNLTDPVVNIRYEIIDYRLGKVGKLEILREPAHLPYRAAKDVIVDEKGRKGLEKGKVYVRHGSQTESPTDTELKALEDERLHIRGEIN